MPWLNPHTEVVTAVEGVVAEDTLEAVEDTLGVGHASRVEEHASQVEAGILRVAAHASRHLGCVRRRRFGRQSFDGRNRTFARGSANWDRRHDHFSGGHRFRFVNGNWIIFDDGFYPYGFYPPYPYGYYPYNYGNY